MKEFSKVFQASQEVMRPITLLLSQGRERERGKNKTKYSLILTPPINIFRIENHIGAGDVAVADMEVVLSV